MNERTRRRWAAAEAVELGWGGVTAVAGATSLSRSTISEGIHELRCGANDPPQEQTPRIWRSGAGRKALTETDPHLMEAIEELVDPVSRGDPQSPLRWTLKSTRTLADELTRRNHPVGSGEPVVGGRDRDPGLQEALDQARIQGSLVAPAEPASVVVEITGGCGPSPSAFQKSGVGSESAPRPDF